MSFGEILSQRQAFAVSRPVETNRARLRSLVLFYGEQRNRDYSVRSAVKNRNLHEPRLKGCSTPCERPQRRPRFPAGRKLPKLPKISATSLEKERVYKEFAENINGSVCPPFFLFLSVFLRFETLLNRLRMRLQIRMLSRKASSHEADPRRVSSRFITPRNRQDIYIPPKISLSALVLCAVDLDAQIGLTRQFDRLSSASDTHSFSEELG